MPHLKKIHDQLMVFKSDWIQEWSCKNNFVVQSYMELTNKFEYENFPIFPV